METKKDKFSEPLVMIIAVPLFLVFFVWTAWITVTAFVGGQAPFFFIEFEGFNLVRGLLWLFIVEPIVLTIAYWVLLIVLLPVFALIAGVSALGKKTKTRNKKKQNSKSKETKQRMPTYRTTLKLGEDVCFTQPVIVKWGIEFQGVNPQGKPVKVPKLVSYSTEDESSVDALWECVKKSRNPIGMWMYYHAEGEELAPGSIVRAYAVHEDKRFLFAEINIE